jgi:hypothetical protein
VIHLRSEVPLGLVEILVDDGRRGRRWPWSIRATVTLLDRLVTLMLDLALAFAMTVPTRRTGSAAIAMRGR